MTFTPLPALGSTDWYGWATDLETEVSKVAGKADATATLLRWAAATAVVANELRLAPDGKIIQRNANGTTRGSYDSTEQALWTVVSGGGVSSVNTRTGAVTLAKADVGLANVDNTSDANKPISTATQAALDALTAQAATLTNRIATLEAALGVNGAAPTMTTLPLVDATTAAVGYLGWDAGSGHFIKATPA